MTRADKIVIILALLSLPLLYLQFWGNHSAGELVQIRVAHGETLNLPLDRNKRIEVEGALGKSIIEIRNRQVRFIDSPCQNKLCVHTGWLRHDGELAACLPNGVTVQIIGRDNRFDAVNF
jgi:hypothetical protein